MLNRIIIFAIIFFPVWSYGKDVSLKWDHDGVCTEYRIYRGQGSGHWPELVGTVDCPTTEFTDLDVPYGDLSWVVTAYWNDLESNASNEFELVYYYALVLFDYDANNRVIYKGENDDIAALEGDTDWVITKYYYNAGGMVISMRVRTTSWTNRATGW